MPILFLTIQVYEKTHEKPNPYRIGKGENSKSLSSKEREIEERFSRYCEESDTIYLLT
jgi:hypothetical protein